MTHYSRDEVEEILRRALETQPVEELSHEDLLEVAEEAGIDKSLVEDAARELAKQRVLGDEENAILSTRRKNFFGSMYTYVATSGFLALIDVMSGPGWWVQWVLAGWGLGLALAARRAFLPDSDKLRRSAVRRVNKRRRPLDKRVKEAVRTEMDRAVEAGVQALVAAAAEKMKHRSRHHRAPPAGRRRRVRVEAQPGQRDVVDAEILEERTHKSGTRR